MVDQFPCLAVACTGEQSGLGRLGRRRRGQNALHTNRRVDRRVFRIKVVCVCVRLEQKRTQPNEICEAIIAQAMASFFNLSLPACAAVLL